MKNKILLFLSAIALITGVAACQSPEELTPSMSRNGINSVTASFPDDNSDENSFSSEINYESHTITIVIPYNYPKNSDNVMTLSNLTKMKVKANLDDNVYVEPSLHFLDLSKENYISVIDQTKKKTSYKILAEIRKSAECAITSYVLSNVGSAGLTGIINETAKTISFISLDNLGTQLAQLSLSHGATISPDPRTIAQNYDQEFSVTVTAQNGTNKAVYNIKKAIPNKISSGIRSGSAKLLWKRKLTVDLGAPVNLHGGLAATKDYVVISTRTAQSLVLNAKTGAQLTSVDVSAIGGNIGLGNFYNTADDAGHVLISNLAQNHGTFKIWKLDLLSGTPQIYIDWSDNTTLAVGRKFSVQGSIDGNAIITAPILTGTSNRFARWKVVGGVLQSQTPDIITVSGTSWTTNVDVVQSSATDVNADYFIATYTSPYTLLTWMNGSTNAVRATLVNVSGNFIPNAVDYTVFNNIPYVLVNYINSFTWGQADQIFLVNAGNAGNFTAPYNEWGAPTSTGGALEWTVGLDSSGYSLFNHTAAGDTNANGNGTGDVAFTQSDDGFYLYVYFMFTNGYVACYQFDCIDM